MYILEENKAEVDPELLLKIVNPDIVNDCCQIFESCFGQGEVSWCGAVQSSQVLAVYLGQLSLGEENVNSLKKMNN